MRDSVPVRAVVLLLARREGFEELVRTLPIVRERCPVRDRSEGRSRAEQIPSGCRRHRRSRRLVRTAPCRGSVTNSTPAVRIGSKALSKSATRRNSPTRPANWSPTAFACASPLAWASSSAVVAPGGRTTTRRFGRPWYILATQPRRPDEANEAPDGGPAGRCPAAHAREPSAGPVLVPRSFRRSTPPVEVTGPWEAASARRRPLVQPSGPGARSS